MENKDEMIEIRILEFVSIEVELYFLGQFCHLQCFVLCIDTRNVCIIIPVLLIKLSLFQYGTILV